MTEFAIFSPYFWPEEIGSAPYCTDLAQFLAAGGAGVKVFAFRPHYPNPADFPAWQTGEKDTETLGSLEIRRVAPSSRGDGGALTRLKNDVSYLMFAIRNAISGRQSKVKTVVSFVPGIIGSLGAYLYAKRHRARFVIVVHDIESGLAKSLGMMKNKALLWVLRSIERIALNRADQVIVLTEGMSRELTSIGYKGIPRVLPIWAEAAPEKDLEPRAIVKIGYSGNFGRKQNLFQMLPLVEKLGQRQDIEFIFRGDGTERDLFEEKVRATGAINVKFLPLVPSEEFMTALQDVDLHLLPQALNVANYAIPSKLTSIMAAGRAFVCIAEQSSPLHQIAMATGGGLCIDPNRLELMPDAIEALCGDKSKLQHMGQVNREYMELHMSRATVLASYEEIINP